MDEISIKKEELLQLITVTELTPIEIHDETVISNRTKIPFSRLAMEGTGMATLLSALKGFNISGQAVSGYYKVTLPAGTHLAQFKNSTDFLGTALSDSTNTFAGQAHLNQLFCDPSVMLSAGVLAAIAAIDKKLDVIQQTQQEMLDFLEQKEKSALKGDLNFLMDIYNNYKYNWDCEKFKTANHIKALDIRQSAGRSIDLYREQIKTHIGKQPTLHREQDVKKHFENMTEQFREYRLALYLYGFSYFLEVLLQENFNEAYLLGIIGKLEDNIFQYRVLYTNAFAQMEEYSKTSLQSRLLDGLSAANKSMGEAIAKVPIVSKSQIDEKLIDAGHRLGKYNDERTKPRMEQFIENQSDCIRPFIENIAAINRLYNYPLSLVFDRENLYISP